MATPLRHRGPDDYHEWNEAGVAFAFRRLSIIDLSEAGRQPMASAGGRIVVMLNGEVYNAAELRRRVESAHRTQWRGHSDTEALVEAIAAFGFDAALGLANGMFAVAAWERDQRALWLGRDRMGKKPLYMAWAGRHFIFGSELKALLAHPEFDRSIDRDALTQFLQLGYIVGSRTIFASASKLPQGHTLCLRPDDAARQQTPESRPFWSLRDAALTGLEAQRRGEAEPDEELRAVLDDAVRIRTVADVPVGVFLSGGIDSSLVSATAAGQHDGVRTFSIGFTGAPWDEAPHARAIAHQLGTVHHESYIGPGDVLDTVRRLAATFDEPFADDSAIPTMMLSAFARRHVTVALSGDGGDELFAGYHHYQSVGQWFDRRAAVPAAARPWLGALAASVAEPLARRLGSRKTSRRLHLFGRLMTEPRAAAFFEQVAMQVEDPRVLLRGAAAGGHPLLDRAPELPLGSALDELTLLDSETYLVDDILVKVDRASMAASLEVRCPLLDYRVVELSWRYPSGAKLRDGVGKLPLRRLLYERVPRGLMERPKMGFGAPVSLWLRHGLRDWANELMSPASLARSGLLNVHSCRRLWTDFERGRSYQRVLWHVLMFQAWHAHLTDTSAAPVREPSCAARFRRARGDAQSNRAPPAPVAFSS